MQFSHALFMAFVASAVAQTGTIDGDVAALADCAKKCIDKATLDAGCKSITDYACQCGSAYEKINTAAAPCVASTCAASDLAKTLALTSEICALVKAGGSSSGGDSSSSAPASTDKSESSKPAETGSSTVTSSDSTDTAAPTTTGGSDSPSSTGETAPSTTGGGAAPSSSTGAAATGSWNFAAAMAGAGAVAAGFL